MYIISTAVLAYNYKYIQHDQSIFWHLALGSPVQERHKLGEEDPEEKQQQNTEMEYPS